MGGSKARGEIQAQPLVQGYLCDMNTPLTLDKNPFSSDSLGTSAE